MLQEMIFKLEILNLLVSETTGVSNFLQKD